MNRLEVAASMVETIRVTQQRGEIVVLSCQGCDRDVTLDHRPDPDDTEDVARLIEHAMFAHAIRDGIEISRQVELVSSYQLALTLGLEARTGHEEDWRLNQI